MENRSRISGAASRRGFLGAAIGATVLRGIAQGHGTLLFVGTYTQKDSKGIYAWRFDGAGKLTSLGLAAETANPSFLAIDARGQYLYAVNEGERGMATAFAIDSNAGKLRAINSVSTSGADPCHLAIDATGKWLGVANYTSGSIVIFPIQTGGRLGQASAFVQHKGSGVDRERQEGPHTHMAAFSPDNRYLMVPDLGTDHVVSYRFNAAKGGITPNDPAYWTTAPRFGPRHLIFSKDVRFAYVVGELAAAIEVFRYDASKGSAQSVQSVSMLPAGYKGEKSGAEITLDRTGNFLYASNRGHDSIAIFRVDKASGKLTSIGVTPLGVKTPRNFAIDPSNRFLFAEGQDSSQIATFHLDASTGQLTSAGPAVAAPVPVCIAFLPSA
jgi:6-phosphogluconolactonase